MPFNSLEEMACSTCRRPLSRRIPYDGGPVTFHHAKPYDDHVAVPVPATEVPEVLYECDFCGDSPPQWLYAMWEGYTGTLAVLVPDAPAEDRFSPNWVRKYVTEKLAMATNDQDFGDTWMACVECARYIDRDDLNRLVTRVKRANVARSRPGTREFWREFLSPFFKAKVPGKFSLDGSVDGTSGEET